MHLRLSASPTESVHWERRLPTLRMSRPSNPWQWSVYRQPNRDREKEITIVAAEGYVPEFVQAATKDLQPRRFLQTDSDLLLRGIKIRWDNELQPLGETANLNSRAAIYSSGGRLQIERCTVQRGRTGFLHRKLQLRCRDHQLPFSRWRSFDWLDGFGRFSFDQNSLLQSRLGFFLHSINPPGEAKRASVLTIENTTIQAESGIHSFLFLRFNRPMLLVNAKDTISIAKAGHMHRQQSCPSRRNRTGCDRRLHTSRRSVE